MGLWLVESKIYYIKEEFLERLKKKPRTWRFLVILIAFLTILLLKYTPEEYAILLVIGIVIGFFYYVYVSKRK